MSELSNQSGNQVSTSLGNSGLCWTIFARNRDIAVPAEGNGDLQTLIRVLVARPRWCLTLSNPVPWQNWMAAYLGYTLRMKTLFRGWPVMVDVTHTRRSELRLVNSVWMYRKYISVTTEKLHNSTGYGFLKIFWYYSTRQPKNNFLLIITSNKGHTAHCFRDTVSTKAQNHDSHSDIV